MQDEIRTSTPEDNYKSKRSNTEHTKESPDTEKINNSSEKSCFSGTASAAVKLFYCL